MNCMGIIGLIPVRSWWNCRQDLDTVKIFIRENIFLEDFTPFFSGRKGKYHQEFF
jgi:hypothetical protein